MEIRAKKEIRAKESDQSASAACVSMLRADRGPPPRILPRWIPWVPRSRDAHERGAHGGRISGEGERMVAGLSPDLRFSAVKNHGLSAKICFWLSVNLISVADASCFWMRTQL